MSDSAPTPAEASKKKTNSYYYWHGHEKERAMLGDVAPMPTPVLVKTDATASPATVLLPTSITKYSWCDGEKAVSLYATVVEGDEVVEEGSLQVVFGKQHVQLTCTTVSASGARRSKQLLLTLAKKINAESCTHKVKESTKQVYVRLVKAAEGSWFELTGKAEVVSDDEDETKEKEE